MNNPFISKKEGQEYLSSTCSINKVILAKLPLDGVEDDLVGKAAIDILGAKPLIEEIRKYARDLNIDIQNNIEEKELPKYLSLRLESSDASVLSTAEQIVEKFGKRLGLILLSLKLGEKENQAVRKDWTKEMWSYWANVKTIFLVGGLVSGNLGEKLKKHALTIFQLAGIEPYELVLVDYSAHAGVKGSAKLIEAKNGINIIFDCGQTNIKRSIVTREDGQITDTIDLDSKLSQYVEADYIDEELKQVHAIKLHNYLLEVISDTYYEAMDYGTIGNEIIISIANYTIGGGLNTERGGYAKLSLFSENYANYLSEELSNILSRDIKVRLVHDGTAVALNFSEYKDAICLSIGTAFGVGFPDINILN